MNINSKLILAILSFIVVPMASIGTGSFYSSKAELEKFHLREIETISDLKKDKLVTFFNSLKADIQIVQKYYNVRVNLPILSKFKDDRMNPLYVNGKNMLNEQLQVWLEAKAEIADLMLVDLEGDIIYSNNPEHIEEDFYRKLPDPGNIAFKKGLEGIYFSQIFRNPRENNKLGMLVTAPTYYFDNKVAGVIALEVHMEDIYGSILDTTALGETGEILIGRKVGEKIVYLNPLRHDDTAVLEKTITLGNENAIPMQEAVQGRESAGLSTDYNGREVMAVWRYIPLIDWGLVAKMDAREALIFLEEIKYRTIVVGLIAFMVAAVIAVFISSSITRPIRLILDLVEKIGKGDFRLRSDINRTDEIGALALGINSMAENLARRESTLNKLSRAVQQSPVSIVITDVEANIEYVNPGFSSITGYSFEEVVGENPSILSSGKHNPEFYEKMWDTLTSGNEWRGELQNKKKNGEIYWEQASISPVFDNEGRVISYIAVKEDITARKHMEEEIRKANYQREMLITSSTTMLYSCKAFDDFDATYISDNIRNITGYSQEEFLGKGFWINHIHPEDTSKVSENLSKLFDQDFYSHEYRFLFKDGTYHWMNDDLKLIRDDSGNPVEILGSWIDITERKSAEELLRKSEERFALAMEGANDGLWDWNLDTNEVYFSPRWKSMLGYVDEEVINNFEAWENLLHPDDLEKAKKCINEYISGSVPVYEIEFRMRHKEGHWVFILSRGFLVNSEINGKPIRLVGTHLDISERKETEEALRESARKLKEAQSVAHIGNWEWDIETDSLIWSDEICRIFGLKPQTFDSTYKTFFEAVHPEDKSAVTEAIGKALEENKDYNTVYRIQRSDGAIRVVHEQGKVLRDEAGKPLKMTGVVQDITDSKKIEAEKTGLEAQLRQAQKMETIGTLAGGIAHDFNNILTPIIAYAELMQEDLDDDDPHHHELDSILSIGMRARDLVRQILAFSRSEEQDRSPLTISSVVKDAVDMIRPILPSTIEIRQHIDSDCGSILADKTQIHQVVMNICANAYQSMQERGGILGINLEAITIDEEFANIHINLEPGRYARLSISDTGCGMDMATKEKIFEPFFTTKEVGKGTGLGLSVVHGIILSHGGDVIVGSEPEKGSTFVIYLPLLESALERENQQERERGKEDKKVIHNGTANILLVDDELEITIVGQKMLEHYGYQVDGETSSLEALERFKDDPQKYDLVITDYTMPKMTGVELSKELLKVRADIPIIIMSGFNETISSKNVKDFGIRGYIMKPFSLSAFNGVVGEVLEEK